MAPDPIETWENTFAESERAVRRLQTALDRAHDIAPVEIVEVLRIQDESTVYRVRLDGAEAVAKLFHGPKAVLAVRNLARELTIVGGQMHSGPHRVMRCLAEMPEAGLVILEAVPGRSVAEVLRESTAERRSDLFTRCGAWLASYTKGRRREAPFGPGFWVRRCEKRGLGDAPPAVRIPLYRLLARLWEHALAADRAPVVQAATHGDFTPNNLMIYGSTLTGIDIQGECWFAISREVARFLVEASLDDAVTIDPANCRLGLPVPDVEAMLASGVLPEVEARTSLPVFVGERLFQRCRDFEDDPRLQRRALQLIGAYLMIDRP